MSFAFILLVVVLFSAIVLLHQYVSGTLDERAHDAGTAANSDPQPEPLHNRAHRRIDSAA